MRPWKKKGFYEYRLRSIFRGIQSGPGINSSLLKVVHSQSLAHAKAIIDGKGKEPSDEMAFGSAFHALLLEGRQHFVIHPDVYPSGDKKKPEKDWNWNANYCKSWAEKQTKPIFSHEEADNLLAMTSVLREDKLIEPLLAGSRSEVSIYAEKNGISLKARLDALPVSGPILDFKSTGNAEPKKFVRQAWDSGYFLQAAFYLDLLEKAGDARKDFWLVAIEKKYPFAHSIMKLSRGPISFLDMGRRQYSDALHSLIEAINKKTFPAYGAHEAELHAAPWMVKELEAAA